MTDPLDLLPSHPEQRRLLLAEMTEAWETIKEITEGFREAYSSPFGKKGRYSRKRWWKIEMSKKERRLVNAIESGL